MIPNKKLVVFDIDGTLTDSLPIYHLAVIKSLKMMGIKEVDIDFFNYKYHTDSYTVKFNYEKYFKKKYTSILLDQFEDIIMDELKNHPTVAEINGAKKCVDDLLRSGFSIAFSTGSLPKPAILKLQQCNIWYDESLIATSKISFAREPFVIQSIEMAKQYFNINSYDKIYSIGDGLWDLQTAQKLNLEFIGIGERNKTIMQEHGMKTWLKDLSSFPLL